jgi:hypothetical protein
MDLLLETDEVQQNVAHRAARLYRFDERKYRRLAKAGFNFATAPGCDRRLADSSRDRQDGSRNRSENRTRTSRT